jgi:acetyl esterase/lipase
MRINVRLTTASTLALGFAVAALAADTPAPSTIDLWPAAPPGDSVPIEAEKLTKKKNSEAITSITNVSKPTVTVSRPASDKNTGVAILVFPGGGYNNLAWEHEGTMVAEWLNSIGVTAAVVKYRVPRRADTPKGQPPIQALMDAQRAISLVRSHASDWGVDPKKIGVLGFSAGGHLGAWCSTNSDKRSYETIDGAEQISCRPDFSVLIYPGGINQGDQLKPEIKVTKDAQPTFLAVATDDNGPAIGSAIYYLALKKAGIPAELHSYAAGGHGFGMRPGDRPSATWPKRCEEWMRDQGILKPKS